MNRLVNWSRGKVRVHHTEIVFWVFRPDVVVLSPKEPNAYNTGPRPIVACIFDASDGPFGLV